MTFPGDPTPLETSPDAPLQPPPGRRPGPPWPWLGLLLIALLGLLVGVRFALSDAGVGPQSPDTAPASRPTFVIATAASPRPSASPQPTSLATATDDVYVVAPGDTLRSIAQAEYGDANQWPKLYAANRDIIGPDPDSLQADMRLRIPR